MAHRRPQLQADTETVHKTSNPAPAGVELSLRNASNVCDLSRLCLNYLHHHWHSTCSLQPQKVRDFFFFKPSLGLVKAILLEVQLESLFRCFPHRRLLFSSTPKSPCAWRFEALSASDFTFPKKAMAPLGGCHCAANTGPS